MKKDLKGVVGTFMFFIGVFILINNQSSITGNAIADNIFKMGDILSLALILGGLGLMIFWRNKGGSQEELESILNEFEKDEDFRKAVNEIEGGVKIHEKESWFSPCYEALSLIRFEKEGEPYYRHWFDEPNAIGGYTPRSNEPNRAGILGYLLSMKVKPEELRRKFEVVKNKIKKS